MSFENKRILLICREVYSYPFYFLVDRWKERNEVAAFFFSPSETKYNCNPSNESSYYAFKKHKQMRLFTTNDISDKFTSILGVNNIIDKDYLDYIEKNYTHYLNVNQQVLSTQSLTRHYHYRNFWPSCNYTQQLNWIILNYKKAEQVLQEYKPDVLLDCDNAELGRCVLREICYKQNIPYVYLEKPRYETYLTFSFNHGLKIPRVFEKCYNRYLSSPMELLSEELSYVDNFRNKDEIMNPIYKHDVTSKYKPEGLFKSFYFLCSVAKLLIKQDFIAHNLLTKIKNPILYPSSYETMLFFIRRQYRKEYLMRKNKYFMNPVKGEKYVYMPLHLIPESTTFSVAPMHINELTIIEAVSKSLPAGWLLYVKEHQAMLGERNIEFYKKVNAIPNVKMVQVNYYKDPMPWIINSMGVVTISGTTAYEAALLGKKAIVFSDVPFSLISTITRVRDIEMLPSILDTFKENKDNRLSCASYIKSVKENGFPIDLKYILGNSYNYIMNHENPDEYFMKEIDKMDKLFYLGYTIFNKEISED